MALAITATASGESGETPSAHLVVTGATGDTILVERIDPLAVRADVAVRGADTVPLSSFTGTLDDYEAPLQYGYQYRARTYLAGVLQQTATSSTITINPKQFGTGNYFFLKNTLSPALNRRVRVGDFDQNDYEPSVLGSYKVLGRANPVVYTDVWGARQGTFELFAGVVGTDTRDFNDLMALLKSGDVLLFQSAVQGNTVKDLFLIVTSLSTEQYTTMGDQDTLDFTIRVGFQEVDRPPTSGLLTGVGTWGDLKADVSISTWQDVFNGNASWSAVLQRYST